LPFVSYYPAILVASIFGASAGGLFALLSPLFVIGSEFPGPALSFEAPPREEGLTLAIYVFASLLTIWLAESRRRAIVLPYAPESRILGVTSAILVAFFIVLLTTLLLLALDAYLKADHLVLGYLLPTIIIAMYYGSTLAVITSFASGLTAAYFLFPPKFSFYVYDQHHVAELGLFLLLAVTASKVTALLTDDLRARRAAAGDAG
jgi:K+-sensing histidine kinase KdpD